MESTKDLIEQLNATDECNNIEAKLGGAIHKSVMESVCSLSNEPDLGGGYILLGLEREDTLIFPEYKVMGITNPDKLQLDLVTQCASMFNLPVRPDPELKAPVPELKAPVPELKAPVAELNTQIPEFNTTIPELNTLVPKLNITDYEELIHILPKSVQAMIKELGKRTNNKEAVEDVILAICSFKSVKTIELSLVLSRSDKYLCREFITPMRESGKLKYTIPEIPNHPDQAYRAVKKDIKNQHK